ncbi:hypothetical protein M9H77_25339 [Catharanthus roseus]|uniref:Uncharacterized protein n=1 Tax=Catharanthus roseus TaxID=4058 RepID=A0ACC0A6Z8_CATRO|nr:hypothetical protein M9H77_25339 [Catharanthus roseus]
MACGRLVLRADSSAIFGSGGSDQLGRPMLRLEARKGDDDLGPVTHKTSRVEGHAVSALSRSVRGHYSTSDIPSTPAPIGRDTPIPFRTHPPTTSYHSYTFVPYDPYGYSQPPHTSYDPYAHAPSLPIRMPGQDRTQNFSKTQIPLNEVSGPGLQLVTQFFEQLVASVLVDSSYSGADYEATDCGIPSSDARLGRESNGHSDDDEPIPVAHASSSGCRPALGWGKRVNWQFHVSHE